MENEITEKTLLPDMSSEIGELAAALAIAQGTMKAAKKDKENPFFKSSYADLASVWEACRDALSKNGLAVIQTTEQSKDQAVVVLTTMVHKSGQWIRGRLSARPAKPDPQTLGSCLTYLRRFALSSIVGISPEEDDGNSASGRGAAKETLGATEVKKVSQKPTSQGSGASVMLSPRTHCVFGKHEGREWNSFTNDQLAWYKNFLEGKVEEKENQYKKEHLEALKGIMGLLLDREAATTPPTEQKKNKEDGDPGPGDGLPF